MRQKCESIVLRREKEKQACIVNECNIYSVLSCRLSLPTPLFTERQYKKEKKRKKNKKNVEEDEREKKTVYIDRMNETSENLRDRNGKIH